MCRPGGRRGAADALDSGQEHLPGGVVDRVQKGLLPPVGGAAHGSGG